MNTDLVWVLNKNNVDFEKIDTDLKKQVIIHPLRPIQLPRNVAIKYTRFNGISIIDNPDKYFQGKKLNRLVIRDAGIGDLLLLEPILRQLNANGSDVNILTRFPEVFENNPAIKNAYKMLEKDDIFRKHEQFDTYEDLRSYSEKCENREKKHRTDCYNQKFQLEIKDKEPRLYFSEMDTDLIEKKEGYRYIGIACDGSHFYRRYPNGVGLIKHILNKDDKNIVVILGDGWRDGKGYVKLIENNSRVIDLQGKTTVRQAINVIKQMDCVVSVDTGLLHIALTLHIPTVALFSIITPELRLIYYMGNYSVITKTNCIGCGNWHMEICKHEGKNDRNKFIPPCMEIQPEEIYGHILELLKVQRSIRVFKNDKPIEIKPVNIKKIPTKKIVMPIIVLNEEKNLPRFISMVMNHPLISKVIAIDGGSTDNTVKILEKAGAFVYVHPYDKNYHDIQALQRNISCSFVKDGEKILIMDIDECFSKDLSDYLEVLAESDIVFGEISRRTFKYFDDINDPKKQIKHYPDYQPRFFTWNRRFKWVGSPHHNIYNCPGGIKIDKDIIHFECEGKNREALEKYWAELNQKTKEVYS